MSDMSGEFEIKPLPILGGYGVQRFKQFGCEDSANFYLQPGENTKRPYALFPTMGRKHITLLGANQLVFGSEPRAIYKSINYSYIVVGNSVYQIDSQFNQTIIGTIGTIAGPVYFSYLVVNSIVFACFTDQQFIYIYQENNPSAGLQKVTDPNAPGNVTGVITNGVLAKPGYIATFGNRIVVSVLNSSQFFLSSPNLLSNGVFNPASCFTTAGASVFAQEIGIIRQMGILNNTLYIFCDFVTGVWSNIVSVFSGTGVTFPWKQNSTYNWNYGMANSSSLDIDFGIMVFLAQNSDGLLQFMASNGGQPEKISTEAIDVMLQRYTNLYGSLNPFTSNNANGFLYQYENSIFYRMSGGLYTGTGILDQEQSANSIEFRMDTKTWHRCIELNGERNRIQQHVYFSNRHLVTVTGDSTVYEMSGRFYFNESRNPQQSNPQAPDAYLVYPFRYERVSPITSEPDYAEFETEYAEIDFVFGDSNINFSTAPFDNAQFLIDETLIDGLPQYIIAENPDSDGQPVFILADGSNTPGLTDNTYNYLYNPHVELYYSDDGGISFNSADVRVFAQMGQYIWKMRWYQLGPSRNRVYKLICVSGVPIVVLGGVMNVRRISGGAN